MAGKHLYTILADVVAKPPTGGRSQNIALDTPTEGHYLVNNNMLTTRPDEPRRSGRATKGQHKNLELPPDAPAKKGKGKTPKDKTSKASTEPTPGPSEGGEEEEIIRCICGEYEEEEDVERDMICCDQCSAWQHNDCMGLTFAKGEEPDEYYCEQCKPENHKDLLDKIAKGEKPWEEVAERRRREAEEKKSKKKKGKKGGRKSQTPARTGTSATPGPGPSPAPATSASAEPEKNGHVADSRRSSTNKRKLEEQAEGDMVSVISILICYLTVLTKFAGTTGEAATGFSSSNREDKDRITICYFCRTWLRGGACDPCSEERGYSSHQAVCRPNYCGPEEGLLYAACGTDSGGCSTATRSLDRGCHVSCFLRTERRAYRTI